MRQTDGNTDEKGGKYRRAAAVNCYEWMEAVITAVILVSVLFTFFFRIVSVDGPSMQPNLRSGDRVLLLDGYVQPKQYDVVVITHTVGLEQPIIKRSIAVEDQTVNIDFQSGVVTVDGKKLDESAYIRNGITTQPSDYRFPLTVPKGCVFVLGDNRAVSNDSRSRDVGMVERKYILGRAGWIMYPFQRFCRIPE